MSNYEALPFYSDNVSSINITLTDADHNASTLQVTATSLIMNDGVGNMALNINSINFSDANGTSQLSTTSLALNTLTSELSLSGTNSSFDLTLGSGATLDLNVSKILLNGAPAPGISEGQSLIAQGPNGLRWFTITDLLKLEAGIFENDNSSTQAYIKFNTAYLTPPSVVITPDSNGGSQLIPISLNGVTTDGFNVIFGSRKLTHFNFIVLPINSTYSINVSDNTSVVSSLNVSKDTSAPGTL